MTNSVFALAAHPDDIEFGMAGTLILLSRLGWEVHMLNVATGSCGSMDLDASQTASIRFREAQNAAVRIGATMHPPLASDLEIFYERGLLLRMASIIRSVAPDVVLLPSLEDYMEDHTNVARLGVTAVFSRGMPNFPVDPPCAPISKPITIYHAQPHGNRDAMNWPIIPELCVDIGDVIDEKAAMLAEHVSQKEFLDKTQGMGAYLETMRSFAGEVGTMSGQYEYAEGWRRHNPRGLCDEKANPLRDALGERVKMARGG